MPSLAHQSHQAHHLSQGDARVARSILVVDDENGVRDLMSRWLQAGGYAVASASDAEEALYLMYTARPAVALCDIRMPGRDGLWLANRIRSDYPETAVIMATGAPDMEEAVASLNPGVVDCLSKPFGRERLQDAVVRAIEWHRSARDSRRWRDQLEAECDERRVRLAAAIGHLRIESDEMLDATLSILTLGDDDVYAHSRRVAQLAMQVAEALGLSEEATAVVRRAALLHDLGKLVVPEAVRRKPAPLTSDEEALVRRYPGAGAALIEHIPFLYDAAEIVRAAQERPDGTGYPAGLVSGSISIGAHIVAAADAYDTMTRPRIFRTPLTAAEAMLELERCSGTQFDPAVVHAMKRVLAVH